MPTRDRWRLLSEAALPAALGQQDVEHEVIVVDDGSGDGTSERLAALDEPRLQVVRQEPARGVAQARNAGIDRARGAWVAFLDDDDVWAPHKLRRQIDAADAAAAGFSYTAALWLDERLAVVDRLDAPAPENLAARLLQWNVIWAGCSNVVARRDLVQRLGGFDERLFQLADWDLWIRLALASRAAACPEALVGYVMQPQSMLLTDRRDVFPEFAYLADKHAAAASEHGVSVDRARFSRWVALGHLRAGRRRSAASIYVRGAFRHRDPASFGRAVAALVGPATIPAGRKVLAMARREPRRAAATAERPAWLDRYR